MRLKKFFEKVFWRKPLIYKGFRRVTKFSCVTSKKSIQNAQKISDNAQINSIVLCIVYKKVAVWAPSGIWHVIFGIDTYIASINDKKLSISCSKML